jgi:hypothetical protein
VIIDQLATEVTTVPISSSASAATLCHACRTVILPFVSRFIAFLMEPFVLLTALGM